LALPSKGHLYEGGIELLRTAGYQVRRASDRQYAATIVGHVRFRVVFMRPIDIVVQMQERRCYLGVTGMDVYAERTAEASESLVVVPDLGFGRCRLAVAVPESWIDVTHIMDLVDLTAEFKAAGRTFRVSTKYPSLVRHYFRNRGIYYYQLIPSDGALELHRYPPGKLRCAGARFSAKALRALPGSAPWSSLTVTLHRRLTICRRD
jgi:ATP phosphoribosyltransferase